VQGVPCEGVISVRKGRIVLADFGGKRAVFWAFFAKSDHSGETIPGPQPRQLLLTGEEPVGIQTAGAVTGLAEGIISLRALYPTAGIYHHATDTYLMIPTDFVRDG
jgi:hypothetical protein